MMIAMMLSMLAAEPVLEKPVPPEPGVVEGAEMTAGAIYDEDYPEEALRMGQSGSVKIQYVIGKSGDVRKCTMIDSSQAKTLDDAACQLVKERFLFKPAKGVDGKPVEETRTQTITWRLPKTPLAPMSGAFELIVRPNGTIKSCKVLIAPMDDGKPVDPCEHMADASPFAPFPGPKNKRALFETSVKISDE